MELTPPNSLNIPLEEDPWNFLDPISDINFVPSQHESCLRSSSSGLEQIQSALNASPILSPKSISNRKIAQIATCSDQENDLTFNFSSLTKKFSVSLSNYNFLVVTYPKRLRTIFHYASEQGDDLIIKHLLKVTLRTHNGKKVLAKQLNQIDSEGYSPLYLAAKHGHLNIIQLILSKDLPLNFNNYPVLIDLLSTCVTKEINVLKCFLYLKYAYEKQSSQNRPEDYFETVYFRPAPLFVKLLNGEKIQNISLVSLALENGLLETAHLIATNCVSVPFNTSNAAPAFENAFHLFETLSPCNLSDEQFIGYLKLLKIDLNQVFKYLNRLILDSRRSFDLKSAFYSKISNKIRLLISLGADPNQFVIFCSKNLRAHFQLILFLHGLGLNLNSINPFDGCTLLHYLCEGYEPFNDYFLKLTSLGASSYIKNVEGKTPLDLFLSSKNSNPQSKFPPFHENLLYTSLRTSSCPVSIDALKQAKLYSVKFSLESNKNENSNNFQIKLEDLIKISTDITKIYLEKIKLINKHFFKIKLQNFKPLSRTVSAVINARSYDKNFYFILVNIKTNKLTKKIETIFHSFSLFLEKKIKLQNHTMTMTQIQKINDNCFPKNYVFFPEELIDLFETSFEAEVFNYENIEARKKLYQFVAYLNLFDRIKNELKKIRNQQIVFLRNILFSIVNELKRTSIDEKKELLIELSNVYEPSFFNMLKKINLILMKHKNKFNLNKKDIFLEELIVKSLDNCRLKAWPFILSRAPYKDSSQNFKMKEAIPHDFYPDFLTLISHEEQSDNQEMNLKSLIQKAEQICSKQKINKENNINFRESFYEKQTILLIPEFLELFKELKLSQTEKDQDTLKSILSVLLKAHNRSTDSIATNVQLDEAEDFYSNLLAHNNKKLTEIVKFISILSENQSLDFYRYKKMKKTLKAIEKHQNNFQFDPSRRKRGEQEPMSHPSKMSKSSQEDSQEVIQPNCEDFMRLSFEEKARLEKKLEDILKLKTLEFNHRNNEKLLLHSLNWTRNRINMEPLEQKGWIKNKEKLEVSSSLSISSSMHLRDVPRFDLTVLGAKLFLEEMNVFQK